VIWVGGWVAQDGFAVDLDELGAARDRIGRLAEELNGPPRETPSDDAFGHHPLAKAVNKFSDQEKESMARLVKEAESIRHELTETIKTYRKADDDTAGQLGGISS
jgi:DNA-binding ferritin-like protein